jgi:hypothetical protein
VEPPKKKTTHLTRPRGTGAGDVFKSTIVVGRRGAQAVERAVALSQSRGDPDPMNMSASSGRRVVTFDRKPAGQDDTNSRPVSAPAAADAGPPHNIADLRQMLRERGLSDKGSKEQLTKRLESFLHSVEIATYVRFDTLLVFFQANMHCHHAGAVCVCEGLGVSRVVILPQ